MEGSEGQVQEVTLLAQQQSRVGPDLHVLGGCCLHLSTSPLVSDTQTNLSSCFCFALLCYYHDDDDLLCLVS